MNSMDLIKAGRLGEARAQLVSEVRARPGDGAARTMLFQTLCFLGEWDGAVRHLDAVVAGDAAKDAGAQVYRNLIKAEKEREAVRADGKRPAFFPASPSWLEAYFDAREKLSAGKRKEGLAALEAIAARNAGLAGTLNGKPFKGFQDADPLLFPFIEAFVHDSYLWIPADAVQEMTVDPPAGILDLIWTRGRVAARGGVHIGCCLPALYPGSFRHPDDRVKMGRMTEWVPDEGGLERGAGQHTFLAGEDGVGLLEIRELIIDGPRGGGGR
ncbi:MAG: hypothetical protein M1550_02920 [Deltaproteobacteria bacterium]|nr:hypothetical protein [Deltaproteobacteria bacterium]